MAAILSRPQRVNHKVRPAVGDPGHHVVYPPSVGADCLYIDPSLIGGRG